MSKVHYKCKVFTVAGCLGVFLTATHILQAGINAPGLAYYALGRQLPEPLAQAPAKGLRDKEFLANCRIEGTVQIVWLREKPPCNLPNTLFS